MNAPNLFRFAAFISDLGALVGASSDEAQLLSQGQTLLEHLVGIDDWLPPAYAEPSPDRYQQYLLYRDPKGRFSVVSFVWGPGQATPVHNHTVWGLVGVLRGAELSQAYVVDADGLRPKGDLHWVSPGEVETVSPTIGDIHRVTNAFDDQVSISIHVYGADIGQVERSTFDEHGRSKRFVSGYAPHSPLDLQAFSPAALA